jgi:hypothetical protein
VKFKHPRGDLVFTEFDLRPGEKLRGNFPGVTIFGTRKIGSRLIQGRKFRITGPDGDSDDYRDRGLVLNSRGVSKK